MQGKGLDRPGLGRERLPPHDQFSKRAINSAADASGLKMRTMENKVHMAGYKTFGILPTPMAFPELFTALQQGTVDGQENPIPVILASKFSQVQKHLSLTGHVYSPAVFILSPNVWNKLSAADKKVFTRRWQVKGAAAMRKRVNDDEARGIDMLKKDGMQVVEKVDGDSFRKAVAPAYAEFAKEFGADKIAAIQAVKLEALPTRGRPAKSLPALALHSQPPVRESVHASSVLLRLDRWITGLALNAACLLLATVCLLGHVAGGRALRAVAAVHLDRGSACAGCSSGA